MAEQRRMRAEARASSLKTTHEAVLDAGDVVENAVHVLPDQHIQDLRSNRWSNRPMLPKKTGDACEAARQSNTIWKRRIFAILPWITGTESDVQQRYGQAGRVNMQHRRALRIRRVWLM